MSNPFRSFIRASAFWRKEIFELLRQPQMILTLVLGPFLILFLFGIAYRSQAPVFKTLFVAPPNSALAQHIEEYTSGMKGEFTFEGVTSDEQAAMERLRSGSVDLIIVVPQNALKEISANKQASFTIYSNQTDPIQANWTKYYGYVLVNEINRRVLQSVVQQGQTNFAQLQDRVKAARANIATIRSALEKGDTATANAQAAELSTNVDLVSVAAGATLDVLSGVQQTTGSPESSQAADAGSALAAVRQDAAAMGSSSGGGSAAATRLQNLTKMDQELAKLETNLGAVQKVDSAVLVNPFTDQVKNVLPITITPVDFFAPAVLALLLQHLAVTFAALSIVQERTEGTLELFRVSPLAASEALLGKYVSYLVFGGIIAALLSALLVYVLHVPMRGSWVSFTVVIALLLFASLSIGFVISLVSRNDSQAVQYTMLVLLTSVFFGGFVLALSMIWGPARVISYLLPATYATILLRDVMLQGLAPSPLLIDGLVVIGVVLCLAAWLMLRRIIARSQ